VLEGSEIEGFEVAPGDQVGAAGVCWEAVEVDPESGEARLVLQQSTPAT